MIDDLKPYPKMKDSGVPWLGEVPEHWAVRKVREVARVINGFPFDAGRFSQSTGYPLIRIRDLNRARTATRYDGPFVESARVNPGDVLVGMDGDFNVGTWRGAEPALLNQRMCCIRSADPATERLLAYLLPQPLKQINEVTWSTTVKHLASGQVERIQLCLPPLPEQAAIVRFLDHADRRIRRYIRAKQKLIKLLDEQKQAIIHRAVTRGLDPNVRLKPSGVEWLGDVPKHWEMRRNGRLFAQRNETGFGGLPILEVSLRTGVRVRDFENSDRKQVMEDREKYKRAVAGDIAYNMMRMWQGAVGVAPVDGLISPAYVVARPLPGTESRYFELLFRLPAYMGEVDKYSRGIVKDRNRLYWEDFKQIPSCCPPYSEQVAIADAIAQLTASIDAAIDGVRREIALLGEFRTRLIADVVTGKLDVREAAVRLPQEAEDLELLDEAEVESEVQEADADDIGDVTEEADA